MTNIRFKKFDKFLTNSIKNEWNIPGIAITIFDSNKILHTYVSGYSNLKTKKKLKLTDKFLIASCSKSMLCAAIASLIEKKKIPNIWNMTLGEVWSKNIHHEFRKIKVKQLAMHNSGIDSPNDEVEFTSNIKKYYKIENKLNKLDGMESRKQLTNIVLKMKPLYKPGSKFEYSNWGYGILGAIIEKITKQHYSDIINNEIMKPLNIDANFEKLFYGKNYVNGHYSIWWDKKLKNKLTPLKKNQFINPFFESPAGETWMSILDCAKYCQSYLKTLNKQKSILKLSTVKYLTKKNFEDYGYGWFINNRNHIYHAGSYFHTTTHFHMIPEKNIGIVLSINTNFYHKWLIIKEFLKILDK
jgi:CubicO group peptidase (beta-lactamase class C family)